MLSKNKIKFIKSLQQKKNRIDLRLFLVEGRKGIEELLKSDWRIKELYLTEVIAEKFSELLKDSVFELVKENELERFSGLRSNKEGLAVVEMKKPSPLKLEEKMSLYLDGVSDPGNLGTILRTADWFGIDHVICSPETVEFYNPKVIQSTMGAFSRVIPSYLSVEELNELMPEGFPVFATFMEGESPKKLSRAKEGLLVMGSESHGVNEKFLGFNTTKISIPASESSGTESLNVAIAASILCYEINRG